MVRNEDDLELARRFDMRSLERWGDWAVGPDSCAVCQPGSLVVLPWPGLTSGAPGTIVALQGSLKLGEHLLEETATPKGRERQFCILHLATLNASLWDDFLLSSSNLSSLFSAS